MQGMHGTHSIPLVWLSLVIAVCASYTALTLAGRVSVARGRARVAWLLGGSVAMGSGIWSMHFVAMLAFHLSVPIMYAVPLVGLSFLDAVGASAWDWPLRACILWRWPPLTSLARWTTRRLPANGCSARLVSPSRW